MYFMYCTGRGLSRPSSLRMDSTVAWVALRPAIIRTGSAGIRNDRQNVIIVTPNNMRMAWLSLLARKISIIPALSGWGPVRL